MGIQFQCHLSLALNRTLTAKELLGNLERKRGRRVGGREEGRKEREYHAEQNI